MNFYYHVCPNCARSYRDEDRERVYQSKQDHTCLPNPRHLEPTMQPFEEYAWANDQLKRAGGVRI